MLEDNDDVPPLDPKKVAAFVVMLGLIAFAGWRYWQARASVSARIEVSKDYRTLFAPRSTQAPPPVPKHVVTAETPVSSIGMLKIDDDMRAPKPAPAAELPQAPPVAAVKVVTAVPVKSAKKTFNRPRLNSGGYSRLNGGPGVGFSGSAMSGGGGGAIAPAAPALPDIPGMPAADTK